MKTKEKTSSPGHWRELGKNAEEILNVRGEIGAHSSRGGRMVARIGGVLATPHFFGGLLLFHLGWIVLNLPLWPWRPWDPYPYTFLATLASAEAPFLSLLVLMAQQRQRRINELREEINLQVSLHVEREATMALRLLRELQAGLQVKTAQGERELDEMQNYLDPKELMENLRRDLHREEKKEGGAGTDP